MIDIVTVGEGFIAGIVAASIGAYKFVASRITPEKAQRIYQDATKTIDDYNAAKAKDGTLTPADRLKLAEDALETLQEIVKDLEQ